MKFRSALKTISLLWFGTFLTAVLGFANQILLARSLGVENYGLFSASLGLINLVIPLALFGSPAFLLKVFGERGYAALSSLKSTSKVVAISTMVMFSIIVAWAFFGPHDENTKNTLLILSISIFGLVLLELSSVKFQLEEKYDMLFFSQLITPFLRCVFLIAAVYFGFLSTTSVSGLYVCVSVMVLLFSFYNFRLLMIGSVKLKGHKKNNTVNEPPVTLKVIFDKCSPFAFAGVFYLLWSQSHLIIIKYMLGDSSAGYFSIALLVMNTISMLPMIIYNKFFIPKMHRWAVQDKIKLKVLFIKGNYYMFTFGIIIGLVLYLTSEFFINTIFGSEYSDTVFLLKLFSFLLPIRFVGYNTGAILMIKNNISVKVKIMAFVSCLNVILNLLLIEKFGLSLVVFTTIVSESILTIAYFYYSSRFFKTSF